MAGVSPHGDCHAWHGIAGGPVRCDWSASEDRVQTRTQAMRRRAVGRVLATPWYPWPTAAIPILHFLTSNPVHFAPIVVCHSARRCLGGRDRQHRQPSAMRSRIGTVPPPRRPPSPSVVFRVRARRARARRKPRRTRALCKCGCGRRGGGRHSGHTGWIRWPLAGRKC